MTCRLIDRTAAAIAYVCQYESYKTEMDRLTDFKLGTGVSVSAPANRKPYFRLVVVGYATIVSRASDVWDWYIWFDYCWCVAVWFLGCNNDALFVGIFTTGYDVYESCYQSTLLSALQRQCGYSSETNIRCRYIILWLVCKCASFI